MRIPDCPSYAGVLWFRRVLFPLLASARRVRARLPGENRLHLAEARASVARAWREPSTGRAGGFRRAAIAAAVVHRLDAMLNGIYARFGHDAIALADRSGRRLDRRRRGTLQGLGRPRRAGAGRRSAPGVARRAGLDFISVRGARSRERLIACGAAAERVRPDRDIGWLFRAC